MDRPLTYREVTVNLENGLHLGPSSQIARLAQSFAGDVSVRKSDRTADAKSTIELLPLGAAQGTPLILEACGPGADEVLNALARLFESNFQ